MIRFIIKNSSENIRGSVLTEETLSLGAAHIAERKLCIEVTYSLKSNAYYDEERVTAESDCGERNAVRIDSSDYDVNEHRKTRDDAKEDRTDKSNSVKNLLDIHNGGLTRTDAGDGAAILLNVVRNLNRVEGDQYVEVRKYDDQRQVDDEVEPSIIIEELIYKGGKTAVREERCDGCGERYDGACEDNGHNAVHVQLHRKVGGLTAVHLSADNTLCVLDRNSALGFSEPNDEYDACKYEYDSEECDEKTAKVEAGESRGTVEYGGPELTEHRGKACDYVCEEDHGNTVADAVVIDLLCEPHDDGRTCTVTSDDDNSTKKKHLFCR